MRRLGRLALSSRKWKIIANKFSLKSGDGGENGI
jgi:hypothetical protein